MLYFKSLSLFYSIVSRQQSEESSPNEQPNREAEDRHNGELSENTNSKRKTKGDHFCVKKKISQYIDVKHEINPSKTKSHPNGEKKDTGKKNSSLNQSSQTHGHEKDKSISNDHVKLEGKKTEKMSSITNKQQNTTLAKVTALKSTSMRIEKNGDACKKDKLNKTKEKSESTKKVDCSEMPPMSFEAYLSYDLEPSKRKKICSAIKNPKRLKTGHKENLQVCESWVKTSGAVMEDPLTVVLIINHQYQIL